MLYDLDKSKLIKKYLLFFSLFGLISVIIFVGNIGTQLSVLPVENSFGRVLVYTQPNYLTGMLKSLIDIEVYLKIFTTSFLGLLFFKSLIVFGVYDSFVNFLSSLNLPINNQDFIDYIVKIQSIRYSQVLIFILICMGLIRVLLKDIRKDVLSD